MNRPTASNSTTGLTTSKELGSIIVSPLFLATHFPPWYVLLAVTVPMVWFFYSDYKAFKALGPGGTPSTPLGYLRIKVLSMFALRNPYIPAPIHEYIRPQHGYLTSLPQRIGPRPHVEGIAPHRQSDQRASKDIFAALDARLKIMAQEKNNSLKLGTSCFEKHGTGLFSLDPIARTCRGEVCHAHPSDGSLHMTLHPADAALVLRHGHGERHPLARGGFFRRFVPAEFVMIYAPRDEGELNTVIEIVEAAVWWVSGVRVPKNGSGSLCDAQDKDLGQYCEGCKEKYCAVTSTMAKNLQD